MATIKKACKGVSYPKSSSVSRRLKTGGSFPDLNKDGKVTKKDVLIGRGVLPKTAKKGMKVKKAQGGDSLAIKRAEIYKANKPTLDSSRKANISKALDQISGKKSMKTGGKMKKCAYGCK